MTKARDLASSGVTLTSTTTTADAALARAGGTMTGNLAMGTNLVDGVDVSARDAVLTDTTTKATAALPKAGGAMTGAITTNSTFDGVDIATRDGILSSTTTTATAALNNANSALSREGGAMTGAITTNSTFDGVDVGARNSVLTSTTTTANAALPKSGGAVTGNVTFGDNDKAIFGAGSDLSIYHNTAGFTGNIIESPVTNLYIRSNNLYFQKGDGTENNVIAISDGAVTLSYDNAPKLATTATGIDVTGLLKLSSIDPILRFNDTNGGTDTKNFEMRYVGTSSPDIDGLYFRTANDALNSYSNKMVILGSGNVGINTSAPSTKIQVTGDSSSRNTIVSNVTLDGGTSVPNPYQGFGFGINFIGRDYGNAVRNYASINTVMEGRSSSSGGGDAGFKTGLSFYTNGGGASGTNPTERLRIASNGNVTFKQTSTATNTEADIGAYVHLRNLSSAINTGVGLTLGSNNNGGTAIVGQRVGANNEHVMKFQARNSAGASLTRMQISGGGIVTTPYQPGFAATRNQGPVGNNTYYIAPNAYYNTGNHYDTSTGIFTAPASGRYFIATNFMTVNNAAEINQYYEIRINSNANGFQQVYSTGTTTHHYRFSWSGSVNLSFEDTVRVYTANLALYGSGNQYSYFSVQLLG